MEHVTKHQMFSIKQSHNVTEHEIEKVVTLNDNFPDKLTNIAALCHKITKLVSFKHNPMTIEVEQNKCSVVV